MNKFDLHPQFLTDEQGRKTSVLLPIKEYFELIEDLSDQLTIAERKDDERVPFDQAMEELGIQEYV